MHKAIIFDCFGVLYPAYADNYIERHKELFTNGFEILNRLYAQIDLGKISQAEFYEAIASETRIPAHEVKAEMEAELIVDPNLVAIIKKLKTAYRIGLLSNAGQEEISILRRDGLADLFDATAVSYEVGDVKPNSKIYHTCLKRLGVMPAESIYFDDSIKNVEAAKKLGIHAIHYPIYGNPPLQLVNLVSSDLSNDAAPNHYYE